MRKVNRYFYPAVFTYEEGHGGYPLTIDGVNQDDMFVYLPYAGQKKDEEKKG